MPPLEAAAHVPQGRTDAVPQPAPGHLADAPLARGEAIATCAGVMWSGHDADSMGTLRTEALTGALDAAAVTAGAGSSEGDPECPFIGRRGKNKTPLCDHSHSGATLAESRIARHEQSLTLKITGSNPSSQGKYFKIPAPQGLAMPGAGRPTSERLALAPQAAELPVQLALLA